MSEQKNKKISRVWLILLALLLCLGATTAALVSRSTQFMPDDSGAIPLLPEDVPAAAPGQNDDSGSASADNGGTVIEEQPAPQQPVVQQPVAPTPQPAKKPAGRPNRVGMKTTDADGENKWETMTPIEIFRISHEGDGQQITVVSDNGDKVIAPGVENSYTFKLKNTGNVPIDYSISMEATLSPAELTIPVEGRISRYDGEWVVGGTDNYENILDMSGAEDSARLGTGRYTYYTLDWRWPFEGDDQLDTMLGNLAGQQDVTLTIVLNTEAVMAPGYGGGGGGSDPDDPEIPITGIIPPDTGDISQLGLWITIALAAFVLLMLLMYLEEREKRSKRREA